MPIPGGLHCMIMMYLSVPVTALQHHGVMSTVWWCWCLPACGKSACLFQLAIWDTIRLWPHCQGIRIRLCCVWQVVVGILRHNSPSAAVAVACVSGWVGETRAYSIAVCKMGQQCFGTPNLFGVYLHSGALKWLFLQNGVKLCFVTNSMIYI